MKVIKPIAIDSTNLFGSNVPEPDPSAGEVEFIDPDLATGADPKTKIGGSLQGLGRIVSVTTDKSGNIIVAQLEANTSTSGLYVHKYSSALVLQGWTLIDLGSDNNFYTNKFAVTSGGESISDIYLVREDLFNNEINISRCSCSFSGETRTSTSASYSFESNLSQMGINLIYSATCTVSSGRDRITVLYKLSNGKIRVATRDLSTRTMIHENDCAAISFSTPSGYSERNQIYSRNGSYFIFSRDASRSSIVNKYSSLAYASRDSVETIQKLSGTLENTLHGIVTQDGYKLLSDEGVAVVDFTSYDVNANFTYGEAQTYPAGSIFIKSSTHRKYQAAVDTFLDPADGVNTIPPEWIDIGPTNRYSPFDGSLSNPVVYQDEIDYVIKSPTIINSVSGFNISGANEITITQKDSSGNIVYQKDIPMRDNSQITNWYQYYFAPIIEINQFTVTDLLPYANSSIEVAIKGTGTVSVGELVIGSEAQIGETNYGSSLQLLDFSRKERDEFGNFDVIRRGTSKLVNYDVSIPKNRINYVFKTLSDLSTIPCVWVGVDDFDDATTVYGYYKDSTLNIDAPTMCSATISVEGLV